MQGRAVPLGTGMKRSSAEWSQSEPRSKCVYRDQAIGDVVMLASQQWEGTGSQSLFERRQR